MGVGLDSEGGSAPSPTVGELWPEIDFFNRFFGVFRVFTGDKFCPGGPFELIQTSLDSS